MWFLCVFYHRLLDYRRPEVESLAELSGAFGGDSGGEESPSTRSLEWKLPENHHIDSPFHFVSLPSEEIARNIANRSKALAFLLSMVQFLIDLAYSMEFGRSFDACRPWGCIMFALVLDS